MNDADASVTVDAATVIAPEARAGLAEQASTALLPAATTGRIPAAARLVTVESSDESAGPPRLMLTTAGAPVAWCAAIQSRPAMTVESKPLPVQSSTRTGTSVTALAMP